MKYAIVNPTSPAGKYELAHTEADSLQEAMQNFVDDVDWQGYAEAFKNDLTSADEDTRKGILKNIETLKNLDSTFEQLADAAFIDWQIDCEE